MTLTKYLFPRCDMHDAMGHDDDIERILDVQVSQCHPGRYPLRTIEQVGRPPFAPRNAVWWKLVKKELWPFSTNPGLTKRQKEFESYISIASSVPSAIVVVTHAFIGSRFSTHNKSLFSLVGVPISVHVPFPGLNTSYLFAARSFDNLFRRHCLGVPRLWRLGHGLLHQQSQPRRRHQRIQGSGESNT